MSQPTAVTTGRTDIQLGDRVLCPDGFGTIAGYANENVEADVLVGLARPEDNRLRAHDRADCEPVSDDEFPDYGSDRWGEHR